MIQHVLLVQLLQAVKLSQSQSNLQPGLTVALQAYGGKAQCVQNRQNSAPKGLHSSGWCWEQPMLLNQMQPTAGRQCA